MSDTTILLVSLSLSFITDSFLLLDLKKDGEFSSQECWASLEWEESCSCS